MYDLAKHTNDYQIVETTLVWAQTGHCIWAKVEGEGQYLAIQVLIAGLEYVYLISKELKNFLCGLPK